MARRARNISFVLHPISRFGWTSPVWASTPAARQRHRSLGWAHVPRRTVAIGDRSTRITAIRTGRAIRRWTLIVRGDAITTAIRGAVTQMPERTLACR
jgi:hypothetical protein